MSVRTSILKALTVKFKTISKENGFKTDLFEYAFPKLKFWDECVQYPGIFCSTGPETREYHPGGFKWAFLGISIKVYVKGENPSEDLESLLEDVEKIIDTNRTLVYDDTIPGAQTTEILINSIVTDEGLLEPYGVGEVNITVQYPVL